MEKFYKVEVDLGIICSFVIRARSFKGAQRKMSSLRFYPKTEHPDGIISWPTMTIKKKPVQP